MTTYCVTNDIHLHSALAAERPRLVRLCSYLTGELDAGEDLAQEVLIAAWQHVASLRDPNAFQAWLNGIARNVSLRWLRARGRESTVQLPEDSDVANLPSEADLEIALEQHELVTLLDRALALLPATTRDVLVQKYIAESSHAAIAEQLGLSENAVAVRLHRGKLALHKLLTTELRDEAASFGLVAEQEWQETRIWCSHCGQHRLRGRFDAREFALRCPACSIESDSYHSQSTSENGFLQDVKGFRPALNRFSAWMHTFFQEALQNGAASCRRCGYSTPLHLYLPDYAPPSVRARRGLHVLCDRCGAGSYESLDGLVLNLPAMQRFWREHPRMRALPQREIDADGAPALLVGFESVDGRANFEAVLHRDSYAVLAERGGNNV